TVYQFQIEDSRVIDMYEDFLRNNPPDHRKVPEALYSIAVFKIKQKASEEEILQLWQKAQASEDPKVRLPCFDPARLQNCGARTSLKFWVESRLRRGSNSAVPTANAPSVQCANCGNTGAQNRCVCTQVYYCNKDCQRAHWTKHRSNCTARKRTQS